MEGYALFEQVFADVIEEDGELEFYQIEDIDGVTEYSDELNYNSGWYNYSIVFFKYNGRKYSMEYKEHTSDNVSDTEHLWNTFKEIQGITLNKDTFTQDEVFEILGLPLTQIHELMKEVEESAE